MHLSTNHRFPGDFASMVEPRHQVNIEDIGGAILPRGNMSTNEGWFSSGNSSRMKRAARANRHHTRAQRQANLGETLPTSYPIVFPSHPHTRKRPQMKALKSFALLRYYIGTTCERQSYCLSSTFTHASHTLGHDALPGRPGTQSGA